MGTKFVIANTDKDWFEILRQDSDLSEVNFWGPSARNFKALKPNELFLFKLKAPHNAIVGGGHFAHATIYPYSLAWEAFGKSNGAYTEQEMRSRIVKYRDKNQQQDPNDQNDFKISCRILTQPFFFQESDWIPQPASWSPNIVSFKTYSIDNDEGLQILEDVTDRLRKQSKNELAEEVARYGKLLNTRPRLGQSGFRMLIADIYGRQCAVTQEPTLHALEAAHIRPYRCHGEHNAQNGLLLRRDIHRLFDKGYVTITPELNFKVSQCIQEEFGNGSQYYDLEGKRITVPESLDERPDSVALTWHNEHCFKG